MDLPYPIRMTDDNLTGTSINDSFATGEFEQILQAPIKSDFAGTLPNLIIISIALLGGTFGNCLVIASVVKDKDLRTVGNFFIVNLALADLCITGIVDPFSIIGIVFGEQWFINNPRLCTAVGCVCLTSCLCSLLSIGAISFNRYIHICHDSKYQKIYTLRNTTFMCVGLWMISFLLQLPTFFGWRDPVFDTKTLICLPDRTAYRSYTICMIVIGVLFPIVLTSICYICILAFVIKNKMRIGQMRSRVPQALSGSGNDKSKEKRESVRLARTIFFIFVLFILCWLPFAVVGLADANDTFPLAVHLYSVTIAHASSSINSIIYGASNRQFRNSYIHILGLKKCLKRQIEPEVPLDDNVNAVSQPPGTITNKGAGPSRKSKLECRGPYIYDKEEITCMA